MNGFREAFAFSELVVYRGDQGKVHHAEMHLGPGIFMFGEGDPSEQGVYVAVDYVDAHYARANAAVPSSCESAKTRRTSHREYTALDLQGHLWSFGSYRPEVT